MRRTCAGGRADGAAGIALPVIQAHLGHESIKTTVDLYGHLDRRAGALAADAIGQTLR